MSSKGIKHAIKKGYDYCIKTRGDSLIGLSNIVNYCHPADKKKKIKIFLLTQQTGKILYKMGDCFMYGKTDLLDSIWDMNNPVFHMDGLRNTRCKFL